MRQGTSRIQPWLSVGLVLAALLCCGAAWAGQVNAVGLEQGATGTRAEIQLQGAGQYRTLSLTARPETVCRDLQARVQWKFDRVLRRWDLIREARQKEWEAHDRW